MPVDTVIDLRQWAGKLAYRLGSLNRFISAAQELLDIIHHLNSDILLRHSRKIVTLVEVDTQPLIVDPRLRLAESKRVTFVFQISRATLIRAGIKLHLFTSCTSALQNYKNLYFDILRALQKRQELISDSDNLKERVNRLLMPLSTWLVIHRGNSPPAMPFSPDVAASSHRDMSSSPPPDALQAPRKIVRRHSAAAHGASDPEPAPEELMPPPPSLPHRFQQLSSTTPRGWGLIQPDNNTGSGLIRMARTRSPPTLPCADPEPLTEPPEVMPPVVALRRTQRFGIFCTAANGGGARRRGLTAPRSGP